jgi:hypothetical protein
MFFATATLFTSCGCNAQGEIAAKEFTFQEFFATRKNDTREYILLGGGWLHTIQSGNPSQFIANWLSAHSAATIEPVSRMGITNTNSKRTEEMVYIWAEDGETNLNVDLVRGGIFPAAVMADMVDNYDGLTEELKRPELAAARAQIEKERAKAPQDRPRRLIPEDRYRQFAHRIEAAEKQARSEKLGIWSDEKKEERQAEGFP